MKPMLWEAEQGAEEADCGEGVDTVDLRSMTQYIVAERSHQCKAESTSSYQDTRKAMPAVRPGSNDPVHHDFDDSALH